MRSKTTLFEAKRRTDQIRRLQDNTGGYDVIDFEQESKMLSEQGLTGLLYLDQHKVGTLPVACVRSKNFLFGIYAGPSLNKSAKNFKSSLFTIYRTLLKSKQKFHRI